MNRDDSAEIVFLTGALAVAAERSLADEEARAVPLADVMRILGGLRPSSLSSALGGLSAYVPTNQLVRDLCLHANFS